MSYPGQSNQQSWQRNQLQNSGQGNMPNQMNPMGMQFSNAPMYNQNISMQSQNQNQNMPFGNPMGNNLNQMGSVPPPPPLFSQTVAYPSARGLNPVAFGANNSQQPNSGQQQHLQHQHNANMVPGQSSNQQNAIGTVTKVHSDCGFVDDEVFFHKNVCKGMMPKVGERVLVEATYNQNSPFKWNATRIQVVSHAHANVNRLQAPPPPLISGGSSKNSGYNAVPPPNEYADQFLRAKSSRQSPSRRSPDRHSGRRELRYREDDEYERKKRREERERDRERHRDRKDSSVEKRERSPVRRVSPKRRRTRTLPRYLVQTPKILLTKTEADVLELRKRYGNLYIPSDFYLSELRWPESFPAHNPFSIQRPCSFHIMHKNVESLKDLSHLEPQDADYLFSAKVMLMAMPPMSELYEKCLQDDVDRDDDRHFVHPTRLINFLVGLRGKNEAMAIGGPWSPSLDGENPDKDPTVLIKTAIRTCKLLTGVDLSACTQWYRFVELYYHRPEACHKGRLTPARTETVVIFLPDVNSCMPTRFEWNDLQQQYKTTLERILNEDAVTADKNSTPASSPASLAIPVAHDSTTVTNASNGTIPDTSSNKMATTSPGSLVNANIDDTTNEKDEMVKKEPTHFSELDPKSMKIQDLRNELNARSLSPKGLKPQLVARLTKALKAEKSQDDNKVEDDATEQENSETENADVGEYDKMLDEIAELDMTDIVVLDEYDSTKIDDKDSKKNKRQELDEKERQYLERRYKLPDTPRIIVHPSKTAKSGKFDCTMMSLSLLLDYRPEDTKEHSFEVSLFAELFNEMLMRDFGFNIYKELVALPENFKEKDEKKKDEKKSEDIDRADSKKETAENEKVEEPKERAKSHERRASDSERSEKKSSKDKDRDRDRDRERDRDRDRKPSRSRNRDDETDDDAYSIVSGEKRKKLSVIVKPELFLSFIYFDTIHCGFILEKDMEDLFLTLGLNLSRSQIRKLLSKVLSRDIFFYRKLTHATKEDAEASKDVVMETKPDEVNIVQLAKGNKYGFPIFKYYDDLTNPPSKKRKRESNNTDTTNESSNEGFVLHNGVLLDVGNLLEQMKRLDKERAETEQLLADLKKQNAELSNTSSKATNKIKDLQTDTRSLSRRLTDAEQNVASLNKKCNEYYTLISSIYDKITPSISKNDRILKNESCRERERDRDREKSRDKDRDKDREKEREKDRDKDREKERDKDREKDCDKEKENHEDSNDTKESRALELKKENSE